MPMPHRTQMQVIKRRLVGKEGSERIRELNAILADLPNYRSGPYADIRKWVNAQIVETRTRARVVHRDFLGDHHDLAYAGRPQLLFDKTYPQPTAGWTFDVAPDGRFLMLKSAADAASTGAPLSLVVVQHVDEELKRLVPVD